MALAALLLALAALLSGWSGLKGSLRPRQVLAAAAPERGLDDPDAVCRGCHQRIFDRYRKTPMARGSGPGVDGLDDAELRAKGFVHRPSGVSYRMFLRDGAAWMAYDRAAAAEGAGKTVRPELHGELRLESFIGSGRRGRTFLYQQEGLWFEAPINWYGKKELWDMAPAYGDAGTMPAPLPVDPNCLHCHTGEAQASVGVVRNRYADTPFHAAGVGCAACHGDPAAHLAAVAAGKKTAAAGGIVNPDKLSPSRRDGVCLQCHLEGDAAVYRAGRSLAEFKPGDELSQSVVYFIDKNRALEGRRASSQYEALLRSACKRASGERLTCSTCHDPHSSPEPAERVAFFRGKCLSCHTGAPMAAHHPEQKDCAVCHMPTRNTLDISHEQLTDHDIEARPAAEGASGADRVRSPELVTVGGVAAGERETGLAYAQIAQHGDRKAGERALRLLEEAERNGADDVELHTQLGFLLQVSGASAAAAKEYVAALREAPGDTTAAANGAVLHAAKGDSAEAMRLLREVVREDPSQTAAGLNLAFLECRMGQNAEALRTVERMLVFHPDSMAAHGFLETGRYGGQVCKVR